MTRPEDQILICVARRSLDSTAQEQLRRLLRSNLDWKYLLAMADRHCLIPLLYHHLDSLAAEMVPTQVISQLRDYNQQNTRSNILLTGELLKLLDCLEAQGIHAIPFKGPALALAAYSDIGLRQFGDVDILVKKQDVLPVQDLLIRHGFTPRPGLTHAQQTALLRFDCSHNFVNQKDVWIDLHWDLVAPYFSLRLDPDRLWDRLRPITLNGRKLLTLSSEDLLLILCLHGFTHLWERLSWICDVAALIDNEQSIDWAMLIRNAATTGTQRIVSLGLFLAGDLLDARVPEELWKSMPADSIVKTVAEEVKQRLFTEPIEPVGIRNEVRLYLTMRERRADKIRTYLRLLMTPRINDWTSFPLPDSLFFVYYPLRPIRLAAKFAAGLFRG